jgi:hypothetical protein
MSRFRRGATPERKRSCREVGPGLLAALPEGEEVVKIAMTIMLAGLGYLFLALCFYVMYRTGSTEGLAGIGNTTLLSVAARRWPAAPPAHQVARTSCALWKLDPRGIRRLPQAFEGGVAKPAARDVLAVGDLGDVARLYPPHTGRLDAVGDR